VLTASPIVAWADDGKGDAVSEMSFLLAVFAIIEHLHKSELTTTSKKLIMNYVSEAAGQDPVDKAREAVRRYTATVLPTLDSIRTKSRTMKLDKLDHLVLKLEYEGARFRQAGGQSRGKAR